MAAGAGIRRKRIFEADHDSPLNSAVTQRGQNIVQLVEDAVRRGNVFLAFQPVVQTRKTGTPAFYEGLIRVTDTNGTVIPARDFFPAVETMEIGRELDCRALGMALGALSRDASLRLSVNMSARSIGYPKFTRVLTHGLKSCATAGERLILEISESSAMMMPELVTTFMARLQPDGITFALDNFGAGQTSFRHLRDFYFDLIKIDGSFIRGVADSTDNQILTQALLAVARQFDMFAVAESVETARDAEYLTSIGMDCMQGYYFGAPTVTPPWKMPAPRKTA